MPEAQRRPWRAAVRRGSIGGWVLVLHGALLVGLLRIPDRGRMPHPMPPSLSLRLIAVVPIRTEPAALPAHGTRLDAGSATPAAALRRPDTPRAHPATVPAAPLPAPSAATPGAYRAPLRDAIGATPAWRLPGALAPARAPLSFTPRSSIKQRIADLTHASRCKYVQMKMDRSPNQFVTRQLRDRMLTLDGCGSDPFTGSGDARVERLGREATGG